MEKSWIELTLLWFFRRLCFYTPTTVVGDIIIVVVGSWSEGGKSGFRTGQSCYLGLTKWKINQVCTRERK